MKNLYLNLNMQGHGVCAINQSIEMNQGEVLLIEGENGSGKTSLLKHLSFKNHPSLFVFSNRYTIDQVCVSKDDVFYVPSHVHWLGGDVQDAMELYLKDRFENILKKERWKHLESIFNLNRFYHQNPKQLSGGEQKRLLLALAFYKNALIYALDEPFEELDDSMMKTLHDYILHDRHSFWLIANTKEIQHHHRVNLSKHHDHLVHKFKHNQSKQMTVIEEKSLGGRTVMVKMYQGSATIVQGLNGSGKSTLLYKIHEQLNRVKTPCSLKPQNPLDWFICSSIHDELKLLGINPDNHELFKQFGLSKLKDHSLHELSQGEIQKAALFMCLSLNDGVKLLDEPFLFLDEKSINTLCQHLDEAFKIKQSFVITLSCDFDSFDSGFEHVYL